MKWGRIPVIAKCCVAVLLVCVLFAPVVAAEYTPSLNEQLIQAAGSGDLDRIKTILGKGIQVNAGDRDGRSAAMTAAINGHLETVRFILANGYHVNAKDNRGRTTLMWAVWGGRLKVVELLLDNGADVNAKDLESRTPLMEAAARDHQLRHAWYYELWSELRRLYRYGFMGPSYPFGKEDPQIVKMLLQKGADVNAKDKVGWTALKRAQNRGTTEIVELLKAYGAKE